MITGLLKLVFNILYWALRVLSWGVLIYCVMTWVIPQNKYTQLLGKYVDIVLNPFRAFLQKRLPSLANGSVDFAPVLLWLAILLLSWIINILKAILL